MYCNKCGQKCADHMKFCTKCGNPLVNSSSQTSANSSNEIPPTPSSKISVTPSSEVMVSWHYKAG